MKIRCQQFLDWVSGLYISLEFQYITSSIIIAVVFFYSFFKFHLKYHFSILSPLFGIHKSLNSPLFQKKELFWRLYVSLSFWFSSFSTSASFFFRSLSFSSSLEADLISCSNCCFFFFSFSISLSTLFVLPIHFSSDFSGLSSFTFGFSFLDAWLDFFGSSKRTLQLPFSSCSRQYRPLGI